MGEITNFLASWTLLVLAVLTFYGQFIYLRIVTLSLVVAFAGGAYAASIIETNSFSLKVITGIIGGMVLAAVSGFFDRWVGMRKRVLALLASFGFIKIFQAIIELSGFGGVRVLNIDFSRPAIFGGFNCNPIWLLTAVQGIIISGIVLIILYKVFRLRLIATAIGDDIVLAKLYGISSNKIYGVIQIISGAIAGFAGLLMANDVGLRPDLGLNVGIKAFGVLIASGGRWYNVIFLTILFVLGESVAAYYISGQSREIVGYVILLVALIVHNKIRLYKNNVALFND